MKWCKTRKVTGEWDVRRCSTKPHLMSLDVIGCHWMSLGVREVLHQTLFVSPLYPKSETVNI
jgi:hypothetical protein